MTTKAEYKVSRPSNFRHYIYTAHIKVLARRIYVEKITAGCRTWKSFAEAQAHYDGKGDDARKWLAGTSSHRWWWGGDNPSVFEQQRDEAKAILYRLKHDACTMISKLKHRAAVSARRAKSAAAPRRAVKRRAK